MLKLSEDEKFAEYDGKIFKAVPEWGCDGCAFLSNQHNRICNDFRPFYACISALRSDNTSVIFVEVESIDNPLYIADQVIPLREEVYGRTTHAELMAAHKAREKQKTAPTAEAIRLFTDLYDPLKRKMVGPLRTDKAVPEPAPPNTDDPYTTYTEAILFDVDEVIEYKVSDDQDSVIIGKIEYWAVPMPNSSCTNCDLNGIARNCGGIPCVGKERHDGKNVAFKEVRSF